MKGMEKEKKNLPNPLWVKVRFYVLILVTTLVLLALLSTFNHGEILLEHILAAVISLLNAVTAYLISKKKQGKRTYQQMMKQISTWTIARFLVMALLIVGLILLKWVSPLPFIFSFIGFYILHQVIEITTLQKEIK